MMQLHNCSGRVCYCEDCGEKIEPGAVHCCLADEQVQEPEDSE